MIKPLKIKMNSSWMDKNPKALSYTFLGLFAFIFQYFDDLMGRLWTQNQYVMAPDPLRSMCGRHRVCSIQYRRER